MWGNGQRAEEVKEFRCDGLKRCRAKGENGGRGERVKGDVVGWLHDDVEIW